MKLFLRMKKKYIKNKIINIAASIILILVVLVCFVYWILPRGIDIENSVYFNKTQVENAIAQMQTVLNEESMEGAKKQISDDWGERPQFGNSYIAEIVQQNTH